MTIRSNPPGAVVYVDNQRIGTTPVSLNYIYYGTREIRLVKDGFETLTVNQPIPAPSYQVPPLDFFSDVVNPYETRDERSFTFQLQPQLMVPAEQLLARAEQLRGSAQQGTPLPVVPGDVTGGAPLVPGASTLPPGGETLGPGVPGPPVANPVQPLPPPADLTPQRLPPGGTAPVIAPQ